MKRKGMGVISSGKELVTAASAAFNSPLQSADIFTKFQSHRSDFNEKWLLLEDDPPVGIDHPPFSEELLGKLRHHLGAHRNARPLAAPSVFFTEKEEEGEEDYVPESHDAEQYRAPLEAQETQGLQGDYLGFSAGEGGGPPGAPLQATVLVPEPAAAATASGVGMRQEANSLRLQRVVPLWSVSRMERYGGYCQDSALVALHQEICDLVDYLRPTQAEISVRRFIEMEVVRLAQRLWPNCEPVVYGSLYTGLLLPLSDVDITITNVPQGSEEALTALAAEVSRAGLCETIHPQLILKTKVPLVKFQHRESLVDVDISVNAGDGSENSRLTLRLLDRYPEARPLTMVIKYFLQQRDVHEPYRGGLGSYATTLLVIRFLQCHPLYTTRPWERAMSGLGRLLVDFFRFYGIYWNYQQCGVSVEEGGEFFLREGGEPSSPRSSLGASQVLIEDPGNPSNNTASSLRHYHIIASLFAHAYLALTAKFVPHSRGQLSGCSPDAPDIALRPTLLSRIIHVDTDTVARRQAISAAYHCLCAAQPEHMEEVRQYRHREDSFMLERGWNRANAKRQHAPPSSLSTAECRSLAALAASTNARVGAIPTGKAPDALMETSSREADGGDGGSSEASGSYASSVRRSGSVPAKRRRQET